MKLDAEILGRWYELSLGLYHAAPEHEGDEETLRRELRTGLQALREELDA
jgi:hypothetical protein